MVKMNSNWIVNEAISKRADDIFWERHPEIKGETDWSPEQGALRKEWMDIYESLGGQLLKVGKTGIRIAPMVVNDDTGRRTDESIWKAHPELRGMQVTTSDRYPEVLDEWLHKYKELGGSVIEVGRSGVFIPSILT